MEGSPHDSEKERLAKAARVITESVQAAWLMQSRMGDSIEEPVRDAVVELITEGSPRAKLRMIAEREELRSREAERLIDRTIEFVRAIPQADASYERFFTAHLEMIRIVRAGEVEADDMPVEPLDAAAREAAFARSRAERPQTAREWDDRARTLRDRGQIEEARAAFIEAVHLARAEGEAAVEGSAEIGLFTLLMRTAHTVKGSHQRMLVHARRGADAYRRAADPVSEANAVVAMITVLTDLADQPNLESALNRLQRLDKDQARWWRAYAAAMTAKDLEPLIMGLRWCVESATLLGGHADFYRKMCEGKLAYAEGRRIPLEEGGSEVFQAGATALEVMANGPTEEAARRLDEILRNVEELRKYGRSQALQRELSAAHEITYLMAERCAEALRGAEAAVDVHELAASRALLAQTAMHQLWRQWHPQVLEDSRSKVLQDVLGKYIIAPTEPNHRLLTRVFGDQRQALERQEQKLLSATPGLTTATSPTPTRSVRALLAENDRVVVCGSNGSIFLISRGDCRTIGRFATKEVDEAVEGALAQLSSPLGGSQDDPDAVTWLMTHLVQPVVDHVPEGCRLFFVPHGALWRIPLGALAPAMLSATREVSYVPSLTLLARLLTRPRLKRVLERFVGFGDPDGSLPHARAEIDHAAGTFTDAFTVTGDRLEYHMMMANLADADVAHFGCHGFFFPDHPDFSALHLAGPADRPEALWYGELARYELNARLVVLAACHAGTGAMRFGSEYVGFPGAFLAAGAQGVLAPLWAVSDASTEALMRHFYLALQKFASPADALRQAQQAMAANPITAHPYHWAGFQLFGAPATYKFPGAS
ncbi:CHAT domain-containing protein [Micromonospora sp. WMMA1949]|uniref:CHAT domain-containing protein n=1 Tax=Micromonospora sp. WMMA1949 TaxID=3015162 RepID=UPI0022B6EB9D|nr:CHAT domain-containing protein [Micromonospora sp. WMMA1949]MCZ7430027.1 CHAT domain-containing protein [Micromonospora sp. WMMA1949]